MVIAIYFAVAGIRQPPYEVWGVLIKVLQFLLLVAVVYLAVRGSKRKTSPEQTDSEVARARGRQPSVR